MSNYFFVKETFITPFYAFQGSFCNAVPNNIFTFPKEPVFLAAQCIPDVKYEIQDALILPSFALKKEIFNLLSEFNLFGTNWVKIILQDKGEHEYYMLQVCNEIKCIDRMKSKVDYYDALDPEDEFIEGMRCLVINWNELNQIPIKKRLIFRDPSWTNEIFFHESIANEIINKNTSGIEFINAEGYSEFV